MILADKIINERKKNGWSQEELAQMLNVSRQSVSKWESAQAIPDLNRIIQMASIFNVSTDYLLKDEIEASAPAEYSDMSPSEYTDSRKISLEEANRYLNTIEKNTPSAIIATVLFILSPVVLIFMGGMSAVTDAKISSTSAGLIGLIVLFIFVACGVVIWIMIDSKEAEFKYLKNELIETMYGVSGMVKEKQNAFLGKKTALTAISVLFFILSPVPLLIAALTSGSIFWIVNFVCLILIMVAIGVGIMLYVERINEAYNNLLEDSREGFEKHKKNKKLDAFGSAYWCLVIAAFFVCGLGFGKWSYAGLIFPIAGVVYAAIFAIIKAVIGQDD
ncbi:MAG: helix-turn-helix domain-containing protein [Lachnospiraceae bacterium]|nr:helix-turn-helix domain-containing protein [Lachnospiraceae bacterium]